MHARTNNTTVKYILQIIICKDRPDSHLVAASPLPTHKYTEQHTIVLFRTVLRVSKGVALDRLPLLFGRARFSMVTICKDAKGTLWPAAYLHVQPYQCCSVTITAERSG